MWYEVFALREIVLCFGGEGWGVVNSLLVKISERTLLQVAPVHFCGGHIYGS